MTPLQYVWITAKLDQIAEMLAEMERLTDVELIQLMEHCQAELDRGAMPKTENVRRLVGCSRRLMVDLFRSRVERDQTRAALRLMEQGQRLLTLPTEPNEN